MYSGPSPELDFSKETFHRFQRLLREKKDLDLYSYKGECIKRRIAVRIRARECRRPEEYFKLLAKEDQLPGKNLSKI